MNGNGEQQGTTLHDFYKDVNLVKAHELYSSSNYANRAVNTFYCSSLISQIIREK